MILLCGIPSETPLAMVAHQLQQLDVPFALFNQRDFARYGMEYEITNGQLDGVLDLGTTQHQLGAIQAVFVRLMDDRLLPELDGEPEGSPQRLACRQLHDTLTQWFEITPARVLNRYGPMGSNGSKPYQAQVITAHGFRTPDTLITNDPDELMRFRQRHRRIIFKSISGVRSIVTEFTDRDLARIEQIRHCPTQFQALIDGDDVRVHVIGDKVFATAIASTGVDYRYAHATEGTTPELHHIDLPDHIAERAVALAADLDLSVAGLDLMIDQAGDVYCLEVNPSPAFSYYEQHTGQPIALEIARYLAAA